MVKEFKDTHYTGPNMKFVAIGNVDHASIASQVNTHFSKITREPANGVAPNKVNQQKPLYTPSCIQIRDDDVELAHVGIY